MEFDKLKQIIADVMAMSDDDMEALSPDNAFVDDLGADSLDVCEIIVQIESEFNISISNEDVEKIITVGDAVDAIRKACSL